MISEEAIVDEDAYEQARNRDRLHILEGLLRALDLHEQIDVVVWNAETIEDAHRRLVDEPFSFTEIQAHHILDMPVRRRTVASRARLAQEAAEIEAIRADPMSRKYGPAEYEVLTGVSQERYGRDLLDVARKAFEPGAHDVVASLEHISIAIDGEGADTRIVVLFEVSDRPGRRFGDAWSLWPSPHPDDYEGTPEWGWLLPEFLRIDIERPGSLDGEPDAQGVIWVSDPD
jgi:hypothetical protein